MLRRTYTIVLLAQVIALSAWAGPAEDTALREAAMKLDLIGVKAALERGANPNAASSDPRPTTPLNAVARGMIVVGPEAYAKALEITRFLFANGATLGLFDRGILFSPISEGSVEHVSLLLDHGASPVAKIEGYTPTEIAIKYSQPDVYTLLLSRGGVPVNERAASQIALVQAASNGDIAAMQRTIKTGALIDEADADGRTALINALRYGIYTRREAEAVWWLLDQGADPNIKGNSGFRGLDGIPLQIFVAMNKHPLQGVASTPEAKGLAEETLLRLLRAGAKVSSIDSRGKTPLHIAAEHDNVRAAEILIRHAARVMAQDAQGKTPLDYAESTAMIRLLKSSGAIER